MNDESIFAVSGEVNFCRSDAQNFNNAELMLGQCLDNPGLMLGF